MLDVYLGDEHVLKLNHPLALEALQWLADLRARHRISRPPGAPGAPTSFQAGNLSMQIQGVQVVGFGTYRTLEDDWDWVPLPVFKGKKRVAMGLASPTIMAATSRIKDAAWALMKFLSGPDAQAICLERGINQPMLKAQRNHPAFAKNKPPSTPEVPLNETPYAVPPADGPDLPGGEHGDEPDHGPGLPRPADCSRGDYRRLGRAPADHGRRQAAVPGVADDVQKGGMDV